MLHGKHNKRSGQKVWERSGSPRFGPSGNRKTKKVFIGRCPGVGRPGIQSIHGGTASFYSFLPTTPCGENVIRVCKTVVCDMAGKKELVSAIEKKLGVKMGGTTSDGKFTLLETNCLGQCDNGPAMLINDRVYTKLTPAGAVEAIDNFFGMA
jgi:hypothetical protein